MILRPVIVIWLLLPMACFSQSFINKSKPRALAMLAKYNAGPAFEKPVISQTDSTVSMLVKEPGGRNTTFIFRFDKKGKCQSEEIIASCDSCYKKYLQAALDQKKYKWKKINENQYISSYSKKKMIELPPEKNDFSYTILRTEWSKKLYRLLLQ
jgi:hypothetical protein